MGYLISIIAIVAGASIPITAIITGHLRGKDRIRLQYIDKEIELEKIRMRSYEKETEKLRLELEHSKTLLLEENNNRN